MYISTQNQSVPISWLFRYLGRVGGLAMVLSWLALVVDETVRHGDAPVLDNYYQAGMLAVVFAGYAVGWRYEVLGGALAILGTIGFLGLNAVLFNYAQLSGAICFATPGVFYLIAHYLDRRHGEAGEWQP